MSKKNIAILAGGDSSEAVISFKSAQQLADVARGAYVLKDCAGEPELIISPSKAGPAAVAVT